MSVWRVRGRVAGLFSAVLCTAIVLSAMRTQMNRPNSCLLLRFGFSVVFIVFYNLSLLDIAFGDCFVL